MSGHSKWSTIKRKKGALDAKRGKIFTKIARDIQVAARDGGPDPSANPALRLALAVAKDANMPKDNQERAIKKGTGELEGGDLEEIVYEGRGPHASAFIIEVLTDNRNRTVAEVRHVFSKGGGELGSTNSVAWMFDLAAVITIPKDKVGENALTERLLELGADDIRDGGDEWVVVGEATALHDLQGGLDNLDPSSAQRQYLVKPESEVTLEGDDAIEVAQFWAKLDDLDDVQSVFCNVSLPDEVFEEHGP